MNSTSTMNASETHLVTDDSLNCFLTQHHRGAFFTRLGLTAADCTDMAPSRTADHCMIPYIMWNDEETRFTDFYNYVARHSARLKSDPAMQSVTINCIPVMDVAGRPVKLGEAVKMFDESRAEFNSVDSLAVRQPHRPGDRRRALGLGFLVPTAH